ncbi:MAG: hypothetical protein Q7R87_04420 [Nanoarchaeota archaeon]|nr:hypothetical protein [Nanoarchaeota archaeon]
MDDVEAEFGKLGGVIVGFPHFEISKKPLFSRGYSVCNGVVLFGKEYGLLSHFSSEKAHPLEMDGKFEKQGDGFYIDVLIDLFAKKVGSVKDISAVLVGGSYWHLSHNEQRLAERNISLIGKSRDDCRMKDGIYPEYPDKSIFAFPKDRRVFLKIDNKYSRIV